jgi:hypothetical protein
VPPFSFAYPANWFLEEGELLENATWLTLVLTPWDPKIAPGHDGIPSNSMKVDIYVEYVGRPACSPPSDSFEPAALGGQAGWRSTNQDQRDSSIEVRLVAADYAGFQYCVVGYFADPPDPTIFDRIIDSFGFAE